MTITSDVKDGIGVVRLQRADRKNAFTEQMYLQFAETLSAMDTNEKVSVIIIVGEGTDFCSGNDLAEFESANYFEPNVVSDPLSSPPAIAVDALISMNTPIIGAVEGSAVGFGATMLLHFDRVVMAEQSYILYPFSNLGVVPEAVSSMLLPLFVGPLRAKKLMMDPQPILPIQALELGLATDICKRELSLERAMEIARQMTLRSPKALKHTKRLMDLDSKKMAKRAKEEFELFAECLNSDYTKNALNQFFKK